MSNPFKKVVQKYYEEEGFKEVKRHAMVSIGNNHYCKLCFCCACVDKYNQRKDKEDCRN